MIGPLVAVDYLDWRVIVRSGLFDHTIAKLFDTYRRMEFQNRDGVHVSYVCAYSEFCCPPMRNIFLCPT